MSGVYVCVCVSVCCVSWLCVDCCYYVPLLQLWCVLSAVVTVIIVGLHVLQYLRCVCKYVCVCVYMCRC